MLRADVRDALFDTIFERYKINLLAAPHKAIACGSIVLVSGADVFGPMAGSTILADFAAPTPKRERFSDIEQRTADVRAVRAQLSFLEALFARFLPADWAPTLSAKAASKGAARAQVRFGEVHREFLDVGELATAIQGRSLQLDLFGGPAPSVFVVSDVFRAKELKITWVDERGQDIGTKVGLPAAASLSASRQAKTEDRGTLSSSDGETVFGVRLLPVANENGSARLNLVHKPVDVLASSEKDDFALVGQSAGLDLTPPPPAPGSTARPG